MSTANKFDKHTRQYSANINIVFRYVTGGRASSPDTTWNQAFLNDWHSQACSHSHCFCGQWIQTMRSKFHVNSLSFYFEGNLNSLSQDFGRFSCVGQWWQSLLLEKERTTVRVKRIKKWSDLLALHTLLSFEWHITWFIVEQKGKQCWWQNLAREFLHCRYGGLLSSGRRCYCGISCSTSSSEFDNFHFFSRACVARVALRRNE